MMFITGSDLTLVLSVVDDCSRGWRRLEVEMSRVLVVGWWWARVWIGDGAGKERIERQEGATRGDKQVNGGVGNGAWRDGDIR